MNLISYTVKKLGFHRGAPRLWLESQALTRAGFTDGKTFQLDVDEVAGEVTLTQRPHGNRIVSAKTSGEKVTPVIDLNSVQALGMFTGMPAVRVIIASGKIIITALASMKNARERVSRLKTKLLAGAALSVAGLAFGGGILDHAVHTGLHDVGIAAKTVIANEIDPDLLEHASKVNDALDANALLIAAPMQEAAQDAALMARLPQCELAIAGIPCSGASRAGKSKHGIAMMEDHPEVGTLVAPFLAMVNRLQPAVVVIENVPEYAKSASAQILRGQFRDMGYDTHELTLSAQDFGCLENRVRWTMVAVTSGLEFALKAPFLPTLCGSVGDILEPIGPQDDRWSGFSYLKTKEVRDREKGNGFAMQTVKPSDHRVPLLRKGYSKLGSTDPLLVHPENSELLRKFTGTEHARIKQVPTHLVQGLCETDQHIVLGQGVAYEPFRYVGTLLGLAMKAWAQQKHDSIKQLAYSVERTVG